MPIRDILAAPGAAAGHAQFFAAVACLKTGRITTDTMWRAIANFCQAISRPRLEDEWNRAIADASSGENLFRFSPRDARKIGWD